MTESSHHEDPEFVELLESIGLATSHPDDRGDSDPTALTVSERERGERMLAQIRARALTQERDPFQEARTQHVADARLRVRWLRLTAAIFVTAIGLALTMWNSTEPARASTPPLLRFHGVDAGMIPTSGFPADDLLTDLANRAESLPIPADLPVQHIELDSWWASTHVEASEPAESLLVPVRADYYVFPNGDFRGIERRGSPLDGRGRITVQPPWTGAPPVSDTVVKLDPERGPDYPTTLPNEVPELRATFTKGCEAKIPDCLMGGIAALHRSYVLSPQLTADLWRTLQGQPEITYLGETVDRLGRPAQVLSGVGLDGVQWLILADPKTGSFLGEERVLIEPNELFQFTPPAVLDFTLLVESRRIAETEVPDDSSATRY